VSTTAVSAVIKEVLGDWRDGWGELRAVLDPENFLDP
jgi:hypothetical protein